MNLLEDLEEVGFGEIYDVSLSEPEGHENHRLMDVSEKSAAFIRTLRRVRRFGRVTVHDGEPVAVEYRGQTPSGLACIRKIRF